MVCDGDGLPDGRLKGVWIMAERRMFAAKITESDAFYSLSANAQALYLHLNMLADEDGFVNNVLSAANRISGGKAALKVLVEKRFLLQFGDVYVIKHWRMANSLKNDRLKKLVYPDIARQIWMKDNRAYTDHKVEGEKTLYEVKTGIQVESNWNPDGIQVESQQNRAEQNRTEQSRTEQNGTEPKAAQWVCDFDLLWEAYPEDKRGNRNSARTAYGEYIPDGSIDTVLECLSAWKQSEQWNKEKGQYIPYLVNWILNGTWQKRPAKLVVPMGASGQLGQAELEAIQKALAQPLDYDDGGQDGL